jgi:hypothetical protein
MSTNGDGKDPTVARKDRDPLYWARGRLVAIRPDGARKTFDPEEIWAIRTEDERQVAAGVLERLYDRLEERDGKPEWFNGIE